jgi:hypothetical protein
MALPAIRLYTAQDGRIMGERWTANDSGRKRFLPNLEIVRFLPEINEKNREKSMRIAGVPAEIRSACPSNKSTEPYRYGNPTRNIPGNDCNEQEVVGSINRLLSIDTTGTA